MDDASKIALLTGFGGVVLGGAITYLTEVHFRSSERKLRHVRNFHLCLAEIERVTGELISIYNSSVTNLPQEQPVLISSLVRSFASISVAPVCLDAEKLFSISDRKDNIFSDLTLFFRRFNATISTFKALIEKKIEVSARWIQEENFIPTGHEDVAEVRIDCSNTQAVTEIILLENLHRDFFRMLVEDIRTGISLIGRLNEISERKYSNILKKKYPKLELIIDFEPLAYLENVPFFSIDDLPLEVVPA